MNISISKEQSCNKCFIVSVIYPSGIVFTYTDKSCKIEDVDKLLIKEVNFRGQNDIVGVLIVQGEIEFRGQLIYNDWVNTIQEIHKRYLNENITNILFKESISYYDSLLSKKVK